MTDITELAQRMKAAAVRAKTATEEYASGHMSVSVCYAECEEFNRLTDGPDNILALVEALEKAQQRIGKLEKKLTDHKRMNQEMAKAMLTPNDSDPAGMEIEALRQRIAELESRTVTVKLPQAVSAGGQGYQEQVERILTAAGIKVETE